MARPRKKKRRAVGILLNLLIVVCAGVLVYALYNIWSIRSEYKTAENEYAAVQEDWDRVLDRETLQNDPEAAANDEVALLMAQYAAQNPDFVGMIWIPGTGIYYPMVQGSDNDWYLTHTFDGTYNTSGAIFMDYAAARDFSHPNTIIYGHNMHNGTMFENLNALLDSASLAQNNTVYILTAEEVRVYEIFRAKIVTVEDVLYTTWFENDEAVEAYFNTVAPGRGLRATDSIITLSTCTYAVESDNRVVAQAEYLYSVGPGSSEPGLPGGENGEP